MGGKDPNAFSDFWHIPSGSPNPSDLTMLHALARIILDETGLRLTSVSTLSGTEEEPPSTGTGKSQSMRMLFMVEVAELGSAKSGNSPFGKEFNYGSQEIDLSTIPITLNLSRYRRYAWSTEGDLQELINSGLYPVEERSQYRMMLDAFVIHKQNLAYLHSLSQHFQDASSSSLHIGTGENSWH